MMKNRKLVKGIALAAVITALAEQLHILRILKRQPTALP